MRVCFLLVPVRARQLSNPFGFSSHDLGFATDRDDATPPDGMPPRKRQGWIKPAAHSLDAETAQEVELTMNPLSRVPDGGHRDGRWEELAQQFAAMSNKVDRLAEDMQALRGMDSTRTDDASKSSSRSRSHSLSVVRLPPKPVLSLVSLALGQTMPVPQAGDAPSRASGAASGTAATPGLGGLGLRA